MQEGFHKRTFFWSAFFFFAGTVLQFAVNIIYPIPLNFFEKYAPFAPLPLVVVLIVLSFLGASAFIVGAFLALKK